MTKERADRITYALDEKVKSADVCIVPEMDLASRTNDMDSSHRIHQHDDGYKYHCNATHMWYRRSGKCALSNSVELETWRPGKTMRE